MHNYSVLTTNISHLKSSFCLHQLVDFFPLSFWVADGKKRGYWQIHHVGILSLEHILISFFFALMFWILVAKTASIYHLSLPVCDLYMTFHLCSMINGLAFSIPWIRAGLVAWFGPRNAGQPWDGLRRSLGLWIQAATLGILLIYLGDNTDWPAVWWEATMDSAKVIQDQSAQTGSPPECVKISQ